MLSRSDFTVFRKACWYTVSVKSGTNGDERISQVFSAWWRAAYEASLSLFCFSCQNLLLTRRMYQWLKSSITNALSLRKARCSSRPSIRSEERRVGKSVDLGGRSIIKER